jgi:prepilin-type N-terminal cleavage/methylation domain-containing protein
MAELVEMMKIQTSITGSKGFTLVELLIVLLIIGVITSVATLSINTARPSQAQLLFNQLKNQVMMSQKIAQLKNAQLRITITESQSKVDRLNPQTQQWESSNIPSINYMNILVTSDESEILILPNGYITPSDISFDQNNTNYQFNPSLL